MEKTKEDVEFEYLVEEKRHKEILAVLKELVDNSSNDAVADLSSLNQNFNKLANILLSNNNEDLISSVTAKIETLIAKLEVKKEFLLILNRDPETENIISINVKQI